MAFPPRPVLTVGSPLDSTDVQQLDDYLVALTPLYTVTVADQTKTNNTMTNATNLSLPLVASARYRMVGLFWVSGGSVGDIKIGQTVPSGMTGYWTCHGPALGVTTTFEALFYGGNTDFSLASPLGLINTTTIQLFVYDANIITTNAGTYQIQFAQQVTDGTAATMRSGSDLSAWRVA